MEVLRIDSLPLKQNPRGIAARFLVERKDVQVINLVVRAGGTVERHITPVDVFFYVVRGSGSVEIGDEVEQVQAGDLIVSPANIPHGLKASPDGEFSLLVVKTPNPKMM